MPDAGAMCDVEDVALGFLASLRRRGVLLVAVSGGSDSMALLHLMKRASERMPHTGVTLRAATIDHGLRRESADEALHVHDWCSRIGIDHDILRWEGEKPRTGLQAAARAARYALLGKAADRRGAIAILTGHTLDDQIETVAMRSRRSQPDAPGLAGMAAATLYDRRHWILRPLLGLARTEVRRWLADRHIAWLDDPSNENDAFERVQLRRERAGRAAVPEQLADIAAASEMRRQRSGATAAFIAEHAAFEQEAIFRLDAGGVDTTMLLQATATLATLAGGGSFLPNADATSRLEDFLASKGRARITVGRALIERARDGLFICRESRDLPVLGLEPNEAGCWDRRFDFENHGPRAVTIVPAQEDRVFLDACLQTPPAARCAAMRSRPMVLGEEGKPVRREDFSAARRIGLYDTFLPVFDLTLANALARLIGRDAYVEPPVHPV